jgi:hypothetical protein
MSDMNVLGNVLADMGDNLSKIRASLLTSLDRVSVERDTLIKSVHAHYDNIGEILMFHVRELERLQGVVPAETEDAVGGYPRFNNDGRD